MDVVEGLSRSLGLFETNMESLINLLSEKVSAAGEAGTDGSTAEQLGGLQRAMASLQESLEAAVKALKEA